MTDFAAAAAELEGELVDIRASFERLSSRLGNTIDELAARVARLEAGAHPTPEPDPEPVPEPTPEPVAPLLRLTFPAGHISAPLRTTLAAVLGTPYDQPRTADGAPGTTIECWTTKGQRVPNTKMAATFGLTPAGLVAHLDGTQADDRWGGSAMTDCMIRLARPAEAAELEFSFILQQPWDFGNPATGGAGKLMGLACWGEGQYAGGGHVGPANFSVSAVWQGYRRGAETLALYLYGQPSDTRVLTGQIHAQTYPTGHLRLVDFRGDNGRSAVRLTPDRETRVRIGAHPETGGGRVWCDVWRDTAASWERVLDEQVLLIDPAKPQQVTHLHLRPMYGGGASSAPLTVKATSILFPSIQVVAV